MPINMCNGIWHSVVDHILLMQSTYTWIQSFWNAFIGLFRIPSPNLILFIFNIGWFIFKWFNHFDL